MSKVNVPFAILSLVTSVLLWASVYNDRNDKPTQRTEPVTLTIRGLADKYVVTKFPDSIMLPLSGYARDFRSINQQAKTAIVDLGMASVGEKDYPVLIYPANVRELLGNYTPTAKISIDLLKTKRVDVIPKEAGKLKPGLNLDPIDTYPHWIYITGPAEFVDKVDSIQVLVNLSSINTSPQEFSLEPRAVDSGNRVIQNVMFSETEEHPTYQFGFVENKLQIKVTTSFVPDVAVPPKK